MPYRPTLFLTAGCIIKKVLLLPPTTVHPAMEYKEHYGWQGNCLTGNFSDPTAFCMNHPDQIEMIAKTSHEYSSMAVIRDTNFMYVM
jgi:hypothetical protein